jgi:hypothetical protein
MHLCMDEVIDQALAQGSGIYMVGCPEGVTFGRCAERRRSELSLAGITLLAVDSDGEFFSLGKAE